MSLELVKVFDHQTSRVKGLSFHPRRPWVIVSLHTGIIQLWDYHHGLLLSVSFHSTQNIFASGGDDAKIKVWNCQSQTLSASSTASSDAASSRSLFTLTGHTDYIRSVSFHNESPWILSASDDQTIRIWNWQSRQCLSILTGHNHYVMNAAFSPLGDMIASCSLDQTVRIWDITGLLRKSSASSGTARGSPSSSPSSSYPDLFAPSEVVVKHIIEGHERGINFVSWHPSGQMLLSASDDRLVKVWQLDAFRAWEVDTYSGHFNNVSSAVFAYHGDIIISNSEDRTLRVWDTHSKACILNFRRDNDRFWFVSGYPNTAPESQMMIFGAAHDNGFSIFKLEKDTPAFTAINDDGHESSFLYVSSGCSLNFVTCALSKAPEKKSIGVLVSDEKSTTNTLHLGESPTSISLNPVDGSILAVYKKESKSHCELFPNVFIPQPPGSSSHQFIGMITSVLKLPALSAVFLSRNRFVVLDEAGSSILLLSSSDKNFSKRIITCVTCDNLFSSTIPNSVYLTSSATDRILLFDVQQERIVSEHSSVFFSGSPILFCCSSERSDFVAFGSKTGIMVLTKKLEKSLSNIQCNSNHIESMALDDKDHPGTAVLYYSTFYNINYALVSGDSGIVLQTPSPMFVTGISKGNSLGAIDRRGVFQLLDFDPTEIRFKYSLACRDYRTLSSIISSGNLVGQSMISFLCRKGHPKLALKYVKDTQTRFDLALECLDIDMALTMAQKLDLCSCWENLAKEAMLHGRVHVVEECYRRLLTSNYEEYSFKLLFLWILTGQLDKIRRFWKENSSGPSTPIFDFICAFVSADKDGIVEMLQASGQHMLAFAFSAINGMVDGSGVAQVNDDQKKRVFNFIASCSVGGAAERALSAFKPNPKAECEWPTRDLIEKSPEPFSPPHHHHHHDLMQETSTLQTSSFVGEEKMCVDGAAKANSPPDTSLVSTEAWGIDDLEFEKQQSSIFSSENETAAHDAISRAQCVPGIDPIHNLLSYSSSVAADHIVIGNFEAAMMVTFILSPR
ncbi:hypothetical protein DI09_49p60 [Mitosporidium daphniae]|uniref:Uncharacterized protein n=1 Tax=Mitosporidium daphniae TaxID=1485682 RepID=A0A098VTE4_9MICR|nr:uncharacterized protein DI09_49p60 [Mitosporidium daphniae]KGG50976.1 hypothetical protein DI09_49p60 [Mitosporidium daphniae]|eukprot:XP_013237424.1 uncharacterized protein DI09_49p60 [Mitosporidium daphniae]